MSQKETDTSIYVVRTTTGRELDVALIVERRVSEMSEKESTTGVKSISVIPGIRGFVFIETSKPSELYKLLSDMKYIKGSKFLKISINELLGMIKPKSTIEDLKVGDEVEIVRGPFKGMRARIVEINKDKNMVTVNILEATFTIPITIPGDYVKKTQR
ncbi:MAG: transcription elongation factor Spt5 [Desulfurococcaceae archaeon]